MLGAIPTAAPADLRHGRHVQSGDPARRLRLQPSEQADRDRWIDYFDALADSVAKPTIAQAGQSARQAHDLLRLQSGARDRSGVGATQAVRHPSSRPQLVAVAGDVEAELLPGFEQVRDQLGEIGFIGLWWDKPPAEGPAAGPQAAFQSDPERFRRLRIRHGTGRDVSPT